MSSNADRAERWMDRALGRTDRDLAPRGTVYYVGDTIYSYGEHFPMAIVMRERPRAEDERFWGARHSPTVGKPSWVLINGDRFSVTTSGHQGLVRSVIARSWLPSIIVPFTALSAANIEPATIEIGEVREDRQETIYHEAEHVSGGHVMVDDPNGRTEKAVRYCRPEGKDWGKHEIDVAVQVPDPTRRYVSSRSNWPIAELHDGLWHWETTRHWLGDSTFRARANGRRRRFLSSFDYQEAQPLYFLCELPRSSKAETVEQAYEDLKPQSVKDAEAAGLLPTRQGDMFAIPTELTTKQVKLLTPHRKGRIVKRPKRGLLGTNHTASEVMFATHGRVYARGLLYHAPGEHRPPDHARRKMGDGKTWHLLVKNTVPRAQATPRTREFA